MRLDRYHQYVVTRLESAWEADRSVVLERMVVQWVIDHPELIGQVGATLREWQTIQGTADRR